jgi:ABC-type branched-subunit amino acid transport system substrate-binding protein
MIRRIILLATALLLCLPVLPAAAQKRYGPGVSDTEIKIGQTMPYSGPLSAVSVIGKSESAYFRMINGQGGINGRRIDFISHDDGYSPPKALEQTRQLVEQEEVLAIMGSFGTPQNAATQKYLNAKGVPQLFIQAGASRWNDPTHFPWTIPLVDLLRSEARVYASYIERTNPQARIAVLYQNDDFGRDYLEGLRGRLGAHAARMVVATATYETTDPTVDSQIIALKSFGADVFLIAAGGKFAAQALSKAYEIGWHPSRFIAQVSTSAAVLKPVGFDKAAGVINATSFKSIDDPQWRNDPDYLAWLEFMRTSYPEGNTGDAFAFVGYSNAVLFADVLRRCGDNLTRENLMAVASHLQGVRMPSLLPGISLNTSPTDYEPIKQMGLQRFDGQRWLMFTDVIEE